MSDINVTIPGGKAKRLKTAGKYCEQDILVTAEKPMPLTEKEVNFYDFDGTLLYAYTIEEAQALTELPPAPTPKKDFLVFDEWNWTLADIKAYNNSLQVGATYKTVDGKTYAVIKIDEDWQKNVTLRYAQWCSSVVVDWGDGTTEDPTTTGSGASVTKTHTYAEKGTYIIKVDADGVWNFGLNSSSGVFFGSANNNESIALRELYVGNGARLLGYAFLKARGLEVVMIPKTATQTWSDAFNWCASLRAVILPSTFTLISARSFTYCFSLRVISFSKTITKIDSAGVTDTECRVLTLPTASITSSEKNYRLQKLVIPEGVTQMYISQTYCLEEVTLPSSITTIPANTFYFCYSLRRLRFKSTTPPTVQNANAFTEVPTTCVVEVPAESLEAYQNATNYASIAAQMVGVSSFD